MNRVLRIEDNEMKNNNQEVKVALLEQAVMDIKDILKEFRVEMKEFRNEFKSINANIIEMKIEFTDLLNKTNIGLINQLNSTKSELIDQLNSTKSELTHKIDDNNKWLIRTAFVAIASLLGIAVNIILHFYGFS